MRNLSALLGAIAALLLQAGCAATASPNTDAKFGDALRVMRAQQSIDPAAARRNGTKVPASDGQLVRGAVDSLRDTGKAPAPSTIGGAGAGQ